MMSEGQQELSWSGKGFVKDYSDLLAYRINFRLSQEIFELNKQFPKEEMYALTDQFRRSSRSIGANIAEAWAKRRYEKHFVSKLTDADGERLETQHWLRTSYSCRYVGREQAEKMNESLLEIGRLLNGMIEKSSAFVVADNRVREDPSIGEFLAVSCSADCLLFTTYFLLLTAYYLLPSIFIDSPVCLRSTASTSAITLTAISSGESAPISNPIGAWTSSKSFGFIPRSWSSS
jgi:four helix bundle protein